MKRWLPHVLLPGVVMLSLLPPWTRLRIIDPPAGPFHRGPVTNVTSLARFVVGEVVAADLVRVIVVLLVAAGLTVALVSVSLGRRWPSRVAAVLSGAVLALTAPASLVLPHLTADVYDGFGVGLAATPAARIGLLASLLWAGYELVDVRRSRSARPEPDTTDPRRGRAQSRSTMAWANSEVLTSVAPSVSRAKS